ncbi:hypothetical protein BOX15_Mlig033063g1 [Macrostomum lignano]|uniref:Rab-GAP TBC domain-containing protein n=1 Tax=Macrostomum lignano TaxID=282301 RepID=A0A267H132_9PLAT|nr:hypothetical protein BOX15_Mlig033063g1 [Macrostomum lignano]
MSAKLQPVRPRIEVHHSQLDNNNEDEDSRENHRQDAERAAIVARYDGKASGGISGINEADPVPPDSQIDHFGFYHPAASGGVPAALSLAEARIRQADLRREPKWQRMLRPANQSGQASGSRFANWHRVAAETDNGGRGETASRRALDFSAKFLNRLYKGVPEKFRYPVWYELLAIDEARRSCQWGYPAIREYARKHSPDVHQIDLDVNRTYRFTEFYRVRYNARQRVLFNVLVAYSMYNTDVGYCQGMSQLAAFLLLYFNDEEEAFLALTQLFTGPRHGLHGFFIPNFPKLLRYIEQYRTCLQKLMPRLDRLIHEKHLVPVTAYAVRWFMQAFLDCMPFPITVRLWDIFVALGEQVLVAMAVAIMRLHSKRLMKMNSDEEFLAFLGAGLQKDFSYTEDQVMQCLRDTLSELKSQRLLPEPGSLPDELPTRPPMRATPRQPVGVNGSADSTDRAPQQPLPPVPAPRQASQLNAQDVLRRSLQRRDPVPSPRQSTAWEIEVEESLPAQVRRPVAKDEARVAPAASPTTAVSAAASVSVNWRTAHRRDSGRRQPNSRSSHTQQQQPQQPVNHNHQNRSTPSKPRIIHHSAAKKRISISGGSSTAAVTQHYHQRRLSGRSSSSRQQQRQQSGGSSTSPIRRRTPHQQGSQSFIGSVGELSVETPL